MNDHSELEAELKKLRPRAASPGLSTQIEHALAATATTPSAGVLSKRRNSRINWFGLGLGLAAAAAFVVLARVNTDRAPGQNHNVLGVTTPVPFTTVAPEARGSFVPIGLTQVVYGTRDEGLHFHKGTDQPVRRLRSQKRETLQWRNPTTGTSLRLSYPSEEVTFIPVAGQ